MIHLYYSDSFQAYNFGPAADVNNTVAEVVEALARHWPGFESQMDAAGQAGALRVARSVTSTTPRRRGGQWTGWGLAGVLARRRDRGRR